MNPETLFSLANVSVLPGWALLIFAPRWKPGSTLVAPVIVAGLLSALYLLLFASGLLGGAEGGFGSLDELARLFANPTLLLVGWVHYLAFDLFIGAWEVRDARRLGVSHWLVVPCLLLTFLAGPVGLLLYLIVRSAKAKQLQIGLDGLDGLDASSS